MPTNLECNICGRTLWDKDKQTKKGKQVSKPQWACNRVLLDCIKADDELVKKRNGGRAQAGTSGYVSWFSSCDLTVGFSFSQVGLLVDCRK